MLRLCNNVCVAGRQRSIMLKKMLFLFISFFGGYMHGFKNQTGHQTVFFLISGSTPVFARFLTGFGSINRTGLATGSRLNRSDRPVRSGF